MIFHFQKSIITGKFDQAPISEYKICPVSYLQFSTTSSILMISSGFIGFRSSGSQLGIFGSSFRSGIDCKVQDEIVYFEETCSGLGVGVCEQAPRRETNKKSNQIFFIFFYMIL